MKTLAALIAAAEQRPARLKQKAVPCFKIIVPFMPRPVFYSTRPSQEPFP